MEADFLWLGDSATASSQAWASFPGVFSYCPVRGPKAGATVYARFSDPRVAQNGEGPVYMAGQFYGAGSVFYMGSAEMWRLRAIDETYFTQFYTKLIRHVSQGRLLRGSSRGVLLVGQDRYLLGQHGRGPGATDQRPARAARHAERQLAGDSARRGLADRGVADRSEPGGGLSRGSFRPFRKAPTGSNCPCPKARTNGSAAASK